MLSDKEINELKKEVELANQKKADAAQLEKERVDSISKELSETLQIFIVAAKEYAKSALSLGIMPTEWKYDVYKRGWFRDTRKTERMKVYSIGWNVSVDTTGCPWVIHGSDSVEILDVKHIPSTIVKNYELNESYHEPYTSTGDTFETKLIKWTYKDCEMHSYNAGYRKLEFKHNTARDTKEKEEVINFFFKKRLKEEYKKANET